VLDASRAKPELLVIASPYRRTIKPLLGVIRDLARQHEGRTIAVVVPELVEPHWYQMWFQSQRATLLKIALLIRGGDDIAVVNTPWYVRDEALPAADRPQRRNT
jgi:hypothetical protein